MSIFNFLSLIIENRAVLGEKESVSDFTVEVPKCLQQQLHFCLEVQTCDRENPPLFLFKLIYGIYNTTSDYRVPTSVCETLLKLLLCSRENY